MKIGPRALQDYSKRLIRILGDDMSRLADSGMLLKDGVRLPLWLEQYSPERQRAGTSSGSTCRRYFGSAPSDDETRDADGLVLDLSLLESWVGQPVEARQPLLMLGLPGSGKSVMFAAFAIHLSKSLLKDADSESLDRLLVPVPVRLKGILDFKEDRRESQPFLRFMYESQRDLDADDPSGELDWPTFKELYDHKALVPLFDGFDELPGDIDAESNVSRRGVLRAIQSSCGGFFGVTSRLGYEAESAIDEDRQFVVRELTSSEVSAFIEHKFAGDERRLDIARRTRSLLQPNLDLLLQRPLFLVAWCELIPRDGSNAPEKLEAVMRELVLRCFNRRRAVRNLSTVEEDFSALGALLAVFADHGFDHNLDAGTLGGALASQPLLSDQAELARTMDLALAAGFVVRMGEQLWYAVKIPVVEFLIGRSVAEDAHRHPADPRQLIDRFRRWIWRPELHDVLDYTFDILWQGTQEQRSWARELLQWAVDVARHDVTRPDCIAPAAHDDMHSSFAVAAMRWRALHAAPSDSEREAGEAGAREAAEVEMRLSENALHPDRMLGHPLPSFLLLPLLEEVAGRSADDILHEFLRNDAVANAASRVVEAEAAAVLDELRIRFNNANDDGKSAWLDAIESVARRLNEKEATALVKNWILGNHEQDETNEDRIVEHWAVSGATERISEDEAKGIVEGLIERQSDQYHGDEHFMHMQAIERAASRVPQATAWVTINEWIKEFDRAGKDKRQGWLVAINSGIERVADRGTADLKEWVDSQRDKRFQISGLGQLDPDKLEQVWSESGIDSAEVGRSLQLEQWASQFRGAEACAACNELIRQGMSGIAFRVAKRNGDIAIISRLASKVQGEGASSEESIRFEAALRKDLVLDEDLAAAPEAIKAALLEILERQVASLEKSCAGSAENARPSETLRDFAVTNKALRTDIGSLWKVAGLRNGLQRFNARLTKLEQIAKLAFLNEAQLKPPIESTRQIAETNNQKDNCDQLARHLGNLVQSLALPEEDVDWCDLVRNYATVKATLLRGLTNDARAEALRSAVLACVFRLLLKLESTTRPNNLSLHNSIKRASEVAGEKDRVVVKELSRGHRAEQLQSEWDEGRHAIDYVGQKQSPETFRKKRFLAARSLIERFGPRVLDVLEVTAIFAGLRSKT